MTAVRSVGVLLLSARRPGSSIGRSTHFDGGQADQSLFDKAFRNDVHEIDQSLERMIWRIVGELAELAGAAPAVSSSVAYAVFDGLFQHALISHLAGSTDAARDLEQNAQRVLESLTVCG